ncbi:MAG: alkaline phosphatase family protein [Chlorobiales bacterium]|nr:alkaline phosphatase family protein [Chlorobiales bacterium]
MKVITLILTLFFATGVFHNAVAQPSFLQSGPMVCYSEMREVALWVQTNAPASVKFVYWDKEKPDRKFSTHEAATLAGQAYTCKLIADSVAPGKQYKYALYINGIKVERPYPLEFQAQALWQWRSEPPGFTVVLGSCAYINEAQYDRPGKPYGDGYPIFRSIHQLRPDIMLWLGDNTYLREADWNTRTGILHRYTHTRSLPELQPLLGSTHHYAIWDDHDFGPNDSDSGFLNKDATLDAFKFFWGNPSCGVNGQSGITTRFCWADVEFFLLDNRFFRTPNNRQTGEKTVLGKAQFEWLIDALSSSTATFKIVAIGGQVLNPVATHETYANVAAEEREKLISEITANKIKGVFFVTGDRHHTELTKLERTNTYPLYDLTVSPLTSGPHVQAKEENNTLRVPNTLVMERNFATITFSGPYNDRKMTITVYNTDGKNLWTREISLKELR